MTTVEAKFKECWDAEIKDRQKRSPSFEVEEYTATGRASAKYGGCSIEGCERKHNARGLCTTHYERWRKNGDPLNSGRLSAIDRFVSKVEFDPETGCIAWVARATDGHYGSFNFEGKNWKAHRWSYEFFVGPVPEGLELDHLCRNQLCVNPDHLEAVTRQVNLQRAIPFRRDTRKTHCPQGHEYAGANLMIARTGEQLCRECKRQHVRRYNAQRKAAEQ